MIRTRQNPRLAGTLALLAVLLRVLLPALHTHDHADAGSAVTIVACSCGAVHAPQEPAGEIADEAEPACEHCHACELEEGTPWGAPPKQETREAGDPAAGRAATNRPASAGERQLRLPQPRAPPTDGHA